MHGTESLHHDNLESPEQVLSMSATAEKHQLTSRDRFARRSDGGRDNNGREDMSEQGNKRKCLL